MAIFDPDSDTVTGPAVEGAPEEPVLAADEIQGNVVPGFGSLHQAFIGVRFDHGNVDGARRWLAGLIPSISTLAQVNDARNRRRRALRQGLPRPAGGQWTNVAFDGKGVALLAPAADKVRDPSFTAGMGIDAGLGDPSDTAHPGHPSRWVVGGSPERTPEALVILGDEDAKRLRKRVAAVRSAVVAAGLGEPSYVEEGQVLDGDIEHFGFRDGISAVGVRGRLSDGVRHYLTRRYVDPKDVRAMTDARPGQALIWPGQFVFGYPRQQSDDVLAPGPVARGGHDWMDDGSFLVLRRLRQDVAAFRRFVAEEGARRGIAPGRVAAMLVGRWPRGTAIVRNQEGDDADPMADRFSVNHFGFAEPVPAVAVCSDPLVQLEPAAVGGRRAPALRTVAGAPGDRFGRVCPGFAHVRKVNPRDLSTDKGGPERTLTFQVLRRGITFGPPYDAEPAAERGLVFLCYQTSIEQQFRVLNTDWMNRTSGPEGDTGHDVLVGQGAAPTRERRGNLRADGPDPEPVRTSVEWITPTGGGYFFSPSVRTLRLFSQ